MPGIHELPHFYPQDYWWSDSPSTLSRLEDVYRRIALRDHVAFVSRTSRKVRDSHAVRLLDVGCGSATLLRLLREKGFDVLGFDQSLRAAAIGKVGGVEVKTGVRLQDGNFTDASFHVVSLFHVLEHVPDPRDLLGEVRRILCKGGRLVLQVPNIDSWQFRLCGVRWRGLDVPRHVINYSTKTVLRLLLDSGFRIRRSRQFNIRDNAPSLASSLFPALDPVRRRVRHREDRAESSLVTWGKHGLYLAAVAAAYPFAVMESLAGAGATVMVEAEKI
ncbi:MAG TPA: class I SAM-dependent methyltransferase [Terriglobia bacterium]|nr:class I SAM-dependent methyltransferase [Terriglobia bacterium]